MSRSSDDSLRRARRLHLDPALSSLVASAAAAAQLAPRDWVHGRLRAAIAAELGTAHLELTEEQVLALMRWVTGNSPLEEHVLPEITALAAALPVNDAAKAAPVRRRRRSEPVAVPFFDEDAFEAAMRRVRDDDQRHHFHALKRLGDTREVVPVTAAQQRKVAGLVGRAPHLRDATESVLGALAVARRGRSALRQRPLLLSGPPATGKTWWTGQVAAALGLPCIRIVMPKVTASFALSGSTPSWSSARPGRIVQEFMAIESATPVLILDEIDKVNPGNYDPAPVLLDLLEPASARRWQDEFFGMEFDVSGAIIVATANRPQDMDPALRSRFREIEVARPSGGELADVIRSAWLAHRGEYPGLRLPRELPDCAVDGLAKGFTSIRDLQRRFEDAVARAARRPGRLQLLPSDLAGTSPLKLVRSGT